MATLKHLNSDCSIDEVLSLLESDAGLIIDNLMTSEEIDKLNSELSPYLETDSYGRDDFTGFKTKRIGALIARSDSCRKLALNENTFVYPFEFPYSGLPYALRVGVI